ncbi:hypothetical protein DDA93_15845 [Arthrobacter sp. Bz4]|nr:hypothetical protein DDA93_15845 [Arthrobacter sp. Bz4]
MRCNELDHLNRPGLCKRCRATDAINELFSEVVLLRRPELLPVRNHLMAADGHYLLQLIKSRKTWRVLSTVVSLPDTARHEDLDQLGAARSVNQVRSLLVDLGALPERDEYLHRLQKWTTDQIAAIPHSADQLALQQFVRWCHQRRPRKGPTTNTQAANDKRELRLIFSLLSHLNAAEQTASTATQEHLDAWAVNAPRDAFRVRGFIRWCAKTGTNRFLTPPDYPRLSFRIGGSLGPGNESALQSALSDQNHDPRMALALLLNVVYGIRVHRIVALQLADLSITDGIASIQLGSVRLDLPAAATAWVDVILAGRIDKRRFGGAAHDETWIFPGYRHGNHQLASSLAARLRKLGVEPAVAHQASSAAIITQVPPAVAARILGISITTASNWHKLTGNAVTPR